MVLHGAGSSAAFVRRAFGPALAAAGYRLVAPSWRDDPRRVLADVAAGTGARLVGGVSRGAHAAAAWAASTSPATGCDGLLLVMPAWTGAPGAVGAASAAAAADVERDGTAATLRQVTAGAAPWVAAELRRAWPAYGARALAGVLRETAADPAPQATELARIGAPAGVVALDGDPLHPAEVARQWAELLPRAALRRLPADAPAGGVEVLGEAAVTAWRQAGGQRSGSADLGDLRATLERVEVVPRG